jgi:hypothetical protein
MTPPRAVSWVVEHQDEIAAEFEAYEPRPEDERDPAAAARRGHHRRGRPVQLDADRILASPSQPRSTRAATARHRR